MSVLGAFYTERTCDGRNGFRDKHDGNNVENRGAEQNGERGGMIECLVYLLLASLVILRNPLLIMLFLICFRRI